MKRSIMVAALALAITLGFALVGCGGAPKDYAANFQGSWKMTSMAGASEDDLALMEAFGMSVVLDLNEDKTASLNMMGEEMAGTWEAKGETECSVTIESEAAVGKLSGEELSLSIEGEEMTFVKITAEEAAKLKEGATSLGGSVDGGGERFDASFEPVDVTDDDICTIKLVAKKTDDWGDTGYVATIVNNADVPIYVTAPFDASSVDGKMVDFWGGATVQPGKTAEDVFIYADSDDVADMDSMKNVELVIEAWNDSTYDTLATYAVTLG